MLNDPRKDPRRIPGTYLKLGEVGKQRLYEVIGNCEVGSNAGMVQVLNCATLHLVYLTTANILKAEIVVPELDEETARQMAPFELAAAAVKSPPDPQVESD